MFKIILLALAASLGLAPLVQRPADLHGLSTHYGPPAFLDGDTMANGQPLDLDAATVAVDVSLRGKWLGREAIALTECGTLHRVDVTDTGRLYEVGGWLRLGVRMGQLRYWPVLEGLAVAGSEPVLLTPVVGRGIEWREARAYRVVADFPAKFYEGAVACRSDGNGGDTQKVWVWLLDD